MTAPDKYDEAIAYLAERPDEIVDAWGECSWRNRASVDHEAGALFAVTGTNCGCLTQIRSGEQDAPTAALTDAIRADHRIPSDPDRITVDHLEVFAEWQRKIDAMNLEASS